MESIVKVVLTMISSTFFTESICDNSGVSEGEDMVLRQLNQNVGTSRSSQAVGKIARNAVPLAGLNPAQALPSAALGVDLQPNFEAENSHKPQTISEATKHHSRSLLSEPLATFPPQPPLASRLSRQNDQSAAPQVFASSGTRLSGQSRLSRSIQVCS